MFQRNVSSHETTTVSKKSIPNGRKHRPKNTKYLSLQGSQKFTQIGIFGLKIYHLATVAKGEAVRLKVVRLIPYAIHEVNATEEPNQSFKSITKSRLGNRS
jgi:hypothetical protein